MNLCSVYNQCGGCKSLEISYEEQLKHKEDKVMKIMENKGITVEKYLGIKPSPEIYEYRNKMEYTFGDEFKDGPLNLGLRGRKKKFDVFYTKDCKICEEDFNKILIETTEFFRELKLSPRNYRRHTGYLRHLLVRKGKKTGEILLLLSTDVDETHDEAIKTWSEKILNLKLKGKIVTIYHCKSSSKASAIKPDVMTLLYGKETFEENLEEFTFEISPFSFFQTNTKGAEILYETALENIEESEIVYDMYSGTGTISLMASKKAKKVFAIEIVEEAVESAKKNALKNNINNVQFLCGDVKDKIKEIEEKPDYVIFDPPRAGLHKEVINFIKEKQFQKIIYVSCNPETMMENIKDLKEMYDLKTLTIVDMFPHTDHVESVALLNRKEK